MPSPEATVSPYLFSLSACIRSIRVHACEICHASGVAACLQSLSAQPFLALHTHTHCWLAGRAGWLVG